MRTEKFNLYVNDNQIWEKDTTQTSDSQSSQTKPDRENKILEKQLGTFNTTSKERKKKLTLFGTKKKMRSGRTI